MISEISNFPINSDLTTESFKMDKNTFQACIHRQQMQVGSIVPSYTIKFFSVLL